MELNSLNNNDRGPSQEHFYEVLLELAKGLGGEDFLSFNYVHIGKNHDPPWGGANFDPRAIIWTILVEDHQMLFDTKYLSCRPYSLFLEIFWSFFFVHIGKNHDTPGAGPILTQGPLFEQSW